MKQPPAELNKRSALKQPAGPESAGGAAILATVQFGIISPSFYSTSSPLASSSTGLIMSFDPAVVSRSFLEKHEKRHAVNLDLVNEALDVNEAPKYTSHTFQDDGFKYRTLFEQLYDGQYEAFERARHWLDKADYWDSEECHFQKIWANIRGWNRMKGRNDETIMPPPLDVLEKRYRQRHAEGKTMVAQAGKFSRHHSNSQATGH